MAPLRSPLRLVLPALLIATLFAIVPTPALASVDHATVEQAAVTPGDAVVDVEPFSMIGLSWHGRSEVPPALEVLVDGSWTSVAEATAEASAPDDGTAEADVADDLTGVERFTDVTWVDGATGYRVAPRSGVRSVRVHLIRNETRWVPAAATEPAGAATVPHDGPAINPRSAWGAAAPTGSIAVAPTLKMAVVHHTAGSNNYSAEQVPGIIAGIQAYHQRSQGWSDIGYNFLVDRFGRIWEGRDGSIARAAVGAHAAGVNTESLGVSLIGTFDTAGASETVLSAAASVIRWKFSLHAVNPSGTTTVTGNASNRFAVGQTVTLPTIVGHRDVGTTNCPGLVWNQLGRIRELAAQGYRPASNGNLESLQIDDSGTVRAVGWAFDVRDPDPGSAALTVNGNVVSRRPTTIARYDVAAAIGGPLHSGYALETTLTEGENTVCAYASESSYGALNRLGCRTFVVRSNPFGNLEAVSASGGTAQVVGWTLDPDDAAPIDIHVYVDGVYWRAATANAIRYDVATAYPKSGAAHGFSLSFAVPEGRREICVYAINVGPGTTNPLLGCRNVGPNPDAVGEFILAAPVNGQALVAGWAYDPDTVAPINVLFFRNGQMAWLAPAVHHWDGLAGRFPTHGTNRLFFSLMPVNPGRNEICAYALNVGPGNVATSLGCHTVIR